MSFIQRKIDLTFKLGTGAFGDTGFTTVTVSGLRVQVSIINAGAQSMGQAQVRVHGLTLSMMNQLAQIRVINGSVQVRFNQIQIAASNDAGGMSTIFQGQILQAPIDMNGSPDSVLTLIAQAGAFEAVKSVPPLSYPGSVDATGVLKTWAAQNNYDFENHCIPVMLATPYFSGSAKQQMDSCAHAAGINAVIDNGVLAIWPKGGSRGTLTPLISPDTGMVGYPTNFGAGVAITTLFNPDLQIGKACQVQSSLPFANGKWNMFDIAHELESETPNGQWFTHFHGSPFNAA